MERDDQRLRSSDAYAEARRRYLQDQERRRQEQLKLQRAIGQKPKTSFFSTLFKDSKKKEAGKASPEGGSVETNPYAGYDGAAAGTSSFLPNERDPRSAARERLPEGFEADWRGAESRSADETSDAAHDGTENEVFESGYGIPEEGAPLPPERSSSHAGAEKSGGRTPAQNRTNREHLRGTDEEALRWEQERMALHDQFLADRARRQREIATAERTRSHTLRQQLNQETAQRLASIHKRQSRVQAGTMLLFVLAAILLTMIIAQSFMHGSRPAPNLVIVQEGRMSDYFDTYGLVARDEIEIKAEENGRFEPIVSEGTRVALNNLLGRIISQDGQNELLAKLRSLNHKISMEIVSLLGKNNFPEALRYYSDADASIYPDIRLIQKNALANSVADLTDNSNSIRNAMANRNRQLDQLNFDDPVIRDLRAEKENDETELENRSKAVVTPQSGFVSFRIGDRDGAPLNPQKLETINYDEIRSLMGELRQTHRSVGEVKAGDRIARVSTGGTQYFLLQVDGARSKDFPQDKMLTLEVKAESMPIDALKILKVSPNRRGILLLCSTQSQLERLLGRNVIEGKILMNSDRGLMVPSSALIFEDKEARGTADIYIVRSGYVHKETVRVRLEDSEQALVEPIDERQTMLSSGSIIVANPSSVREGQAVE